MLETTAQGLNPWAEQGHDSQRSLFCALLVLGYSACGALAAGQGRLLPKVPVPLPLLTHM